MDLEQKEFYQKIGLNKRKYKILPQGVHMNTVDKGKIEEYTIRFEDLGSTLHFVSNKTAAMYVGVIIFTLLQIVGLILSLIDGEVAIMRPLFIFSVTGCVIGLYFMPRLLNNGKVYIIYGKKNLMLYSNIPSRIEVENFISDILEAKKEFYLTPTEISSLAIFNVFSDNSVEFYDMWYVTKDDMPLLRFFHTLNEFDRWLEEESKRILDEELNNQS